MPPPRKINQATRKAEQPSPTLTFPCSSTRDVEPKACSIPICNNEYEYAICNMRVAALALHDFEYTQFLSGNSASQTARTHHHSGSIAR